MASSSSQFLFLLLLSTTFAIFLSSANGKTITPRPFLLPVSKDDETRQFYTTVDVGTPPISNRLVIDIGAHVSWFNCDNGYNSSSYRHIKCGSTKCAAAKGFNCIGCHGPARPGCCNNTCGLYAYNPIAGANYFAGLGVETMLLGTSDGSRSRCARVRRVPFTCGFKDTLDGLAKVAQGMIGFSQSQLALPSYLSSVYKVARKVAVCLPTTSDDGGDIVIGGGPYFLPPYKGDVSKLFTRTPLLINPVSTAPMYMEGDASDEYFIGVTSILVDGRPVSFNKSLLSIDKSGYGGTKISTVNSYTALHSDIYNAVIREFIKSAESRMLTRVKRVAPFGVCFDSRQNINFPTFDLLLQNRTTYWRIYGENSMVKVKEDVLCLGFVDGGGNWVRTSIVIGSHLLENNLLEFDLEKSMLGFTSLRQHGTGC